MLTVTSRGVLPAEVTSFVGRSRELKSTRSLIAASRLVTLTGVGGVGKTRLAVRMAMEVERAFSGGVRFTDLTNVPTGANSTALLQVIAGALELDNFSARPMRETVIDHLRTRHCLLVIDNCEHVVDTVGSVVANLLAEAENLHVLATSREVLGCAGEYVVAVRPLTVPDAADSAPGSPDGEAMELLRHRADAVGAPIQESDFVAASELCRQLDGLPLAIELAASRLNILSVSEILDRLDNRFGLLSGIRHGPVAHQTLRRVMDWSYQLCSIQGRLLWERVSVFVGGFDLASVEAICTGDGISREDVLETLAGLARQSILTVDRGDGRSRYHLLETLRQYGLEMLSHRGAEEMFRRRHLDYFHELAMRASRDWFSPRELDWLRWGRVEMPNLRAAMDISLMGGQGTQGLEIAIGLTQLRLWYIIGWPGEGVSRLKLLAQQDPEPTGVLRVTALGHAGWISLAQGDPEAAREFLADCQPMGEERPQESPTVDFLEAAFLLFVDNDARSITMLEELLRKLQKAGAPDAVTARIESLWGIAACFLGDRTVAIEASEQHLRNTKEHEAECAISWALMNVAIAQMRHGDPNRALTIMREVVYRQSDIGDRWGTLWAVHGVAWALAAGIRTTEGGKEAESRIAEQVARMLGGAQRLRAWTGVVAGGMFKDATATAEGVARRLLGERRYAQAFEEGNFPDAGRAYAEQQILLLAQGNGASAPAETTQPTVPEQPRELPGERLTARELEISGLVARGWGNDEIARNLVISSRTVHSHVGNILKKRGLRNRNEIAVWYIKQYG
ncbi:LuxR C-terminal-related transcriptional regulator [Pseudonocardia spinosispora]|uniref:LuxR C-terminal-related transcriptional regulator n=1 Tax=Pseudonocardia spinosispora TaxID=103441 RepID=UPI000684CF38|nr:LuxR C-terminal-related transcriptional regulator [Pseudonocardia spinosispora]